MTQTLRARHVASPLPLLEFHLLWQQVLGVSRAWLLAHDTDPLDAAACAAYDALEARRVAGEPMAYILGRREFFGHDFRVTPAVLIPRPETELLVECGLQAIEGLQAPRVLDLGTGSGAVAVSVALARPDARVCATDCSAAALAIATMNASALGATVQFLCGNWYDTLRPSMRFDLIVANPPYVASDDAHLSAGDLRFEPLCALTDGADGLSALRQIIRDAPHHLAEGGALCVEHGFDQAGAVRGLFLDSGFDAIDSLRDLAGVERVTRGRLAAPIL